MAGVRDGGGISVTYTMTMREAIAARVAEAPVETAWYLVLYGGLLIHLSVRCLFFGDDVGLLLLAIASASWALHRIKKGADRVSGGPVTVAAGVDGLTYETPAKSTTLPWEVWGKASRRFGIWTVRLAAQPTTKISIPVRALDGEQNTALADMFAEHGLHVRTSRRGTTTDA